MEITDSQRALLEFIRGEGHHYGVGIWTRWAYGKWPASVAESERAKHEACLELERLGLLRRKTVDDEHQCIFWIPEEVN